VVIGAVVVVVIEGLVFPEPAPLSALAPCDLVIPTLAFNKFTGCARGSLMGDPIPAGEDVPAGEDEVGVGGNDFNALL
jgi:hypothetical protein